MKKTKITTIRFLSFFVLFLTSILNAQTADTLTQKEQSLPEVLIQSTPIIDQLQRIPASVQVISAQNLERGDQTSVRNELNKAPGIFMQQGALNTSRISIRGIGARSPYSTNRVKAYFEGIPLTSGEGETTLEDIDLNLIGGIEVIKGPASSSYGSGLGGVINISAKKAVSDNVEVSTMGGSYGLFKYGGTVNMANENSGISLGYYNLSSDGFRENSSYRRQNLSLYATTNLNAENKLSLFTNLTRLKAFIPSSLSAEDFKNNPPKAAFTWGQAKGYESYDKALLGLSHTWTPNEHWRWTTSVFTNYRDGYEPRPFNILDEKSTAFGIRSNLKNNFEIFGFDAKSSLGVEYFDERYTVSTFENLYESNDGNGTLQGNRLNEAKQDRKYLNLFAQLNLQLTDLLKAELGLSYNHSRYILEDQLNENQDDRNVYTYPRQFLPRLSLTYETFPDKFIYANVSKGFSLPSVEETLTPEGVINTDLKPETGVNYEIGLKATWLDKKLYTEVALYTIQIDNLLVAERVGNDQYVGINAGKTDHNGLEVTLNYAEDISQYWSLKPYVSASFNDYKFDQFEDRDNDYSGNDLTGVPNHILNFGLDVEQRNGFRFSVNYRNVGMIPLNDENSLYTENYNLVNLRAGYDLNILFGTSTRIFAGINNLFDTHYAAQVLPNATGFDGSAPRYYYPGEPVNFYAGVRFSFRDF